MSLDFKKIYFIILISFIFYTKNVSSSDQFSNKFIFDFEINFKNFFLYDESMTSGKLDRIFVNLEDKFYSSLEEKLSYSNSINIIKGNNYLDVEVNQEYFSWDSIKINNFDENINFKLIHMNQNYDLTNAKESYESLSYEKIFELSIPKKIKPRNDIIYIAQRELNLEHSSTWVYNQKDNYSWIRSRNFPENVTFDKIEFVFLNNKNFDFYQEIFKRSSLKFKKKSVSFFSFLSKWEVVLFDYLPSYYEIKDEFIHFNFIVPRSYTRDYFLDELIISSSEQNFILAKDDPSILMEELLLMDVSLGVINKNDNIAWYTHIEDSNDIILDLSFLGLYDRELGQQGKKKIKLISSRDFDFNIELGNAFKDLKNFYNNVNSKNRLNIIKKIISENFDESKFRFENKCFNVLGYKILIARPFNFTLDTEKIECQQNIKQIDNKNFSVSRYITIEDFKIIEKKFKSEDDLVVKKNEKFSNYLFLFFDIFLSLIIVLFLFIYKKIIINNKDFLINYRYVLMFFSIMFFSLFNINFIFLFLLFFYISFVHNFFFNK